MYPVGYIVNAMTNTNTHTTGYYITKEPQRGAWKLHHITEPGCGVWSRDKRRLLRLAKHNSRGAAYPQCLRNLMRDTATAGYSSRRNAQLSIPNA